MIPLLLGENNTPLYTAAHHMEAHGGFNVILDKILSLFVSYNIVWFAVTSALPAALVTTV